MIVERIKTNAQEIKIPDPRLEEEEFGLETTVLQNKDGATEAGFREGTELGGFMLTKLGGRGNMAICGQWCKNWCR